MQVSRLFSALLQLANNGNLIILRGSSPGQPFQLRLASLEKKHQHFEDYRAPSFLQAKVRGLPCAGWCSSQPWQMDDLTCNTVLDTECLKEKGSFSSSI